jgi:hypothetical protein
MAGFVIFFSLFGLLLGLSLAVVVSGFARLLKTRPRVWPGWLTTLLGIFIMLDITSFWSGAWRARERMVPEYGHLFLAMVVISVYYLAASMVFPAEGTTSEDFDAHYFENRRPILLAIGLCNLAVFGWQDVLEIRDLPRAWWFTVPLYYALLVVAAFTRSRRLSIACLMGLITVYLSFAAFSLFWPALGQLNG